MATKGWLQYGDTHSSIVVQDSLTTPITAASRLSGMWSFAYAGNSTGWTSVSASPANVPTHDPVLGMKAISSTDGITDCGYRFQTPNAALDKIHLEGQLTIEVQGAWADAVDTALGFLGDTKQTQESLLSFLTAASAAGYFFQAFTTGGVIGYPASGSPCNLDYRNHINGASATAKISSQSRPVDGFRKLHIGWKGTRGFFAIDGVIVNSGVRSVPSPAAMATMLNNFYIGSDRGTVGRHVKAHWFRNIQIATEAPSFALSGNHPYIGILSDSIFDNATPAHATAGHDTAFYRIAKLFEERGLRTNILVSENGGYSIDSNATNTLHSVYTQVTKCPDVVVQGITNDVLIGGSTSVNRLEAQALLLAEKLLGLNGNPATKVQRVRFTTSIPLHGARLDPAYAVEQALMVQARGIMLGLPAVFDAAYPAHAGKVRVIDTFTALDDAYTRGEQYLFFGQTDGTWLDVHLRANGLRIHGDTIGRAFFE